MNIAAYFARIGLELPENPQPTSELLKKIHFAHCCSVPYENYDMMRGIPTSLDDEALFEKIVVKGMGGICFELNGALAMLLRALGYGVTEYASRYLRGEAAVPMRRHRVLKVEAMDGIWLCDVGIGERAQREPIALVEGLIQEQYGETYRLYKDDFLGWVLEDFHKGVWADFYSFTEEPQLVADYVALNFYCEKHPDSPFNKDEMFALKTPDGRITLDGHIYKEIHGDQIIVKELSDGEMPWAYTRFGLKM